MLPWVITPMGNTRNTVTSSNICPVLLSGMPVTKTVACSLVFGLALVLSYPNIARADHNSARTDFQKNNLKQSRRYMKRMQKQQKKALKAAARKSH